MYPFLRMFKEMVRASRMPPLGLFDTHVSHHLCWPWDLDPWVELNNGLTCLADNDPTQMFEYGDVKQYWGTSHVKQIGNFYQSLLGLAPMYVTAENAFLTQEMICALYEHGRRHFVREVR